MEYRGEVDDLAPHLMDADLVLVPTTRPEPFGLIALEAWAAGRRVIAADEGGLAEAARLVGGVMFKARDVDALASAIIHVAESPELLAGPSPEAEASARCTTESREAAWLSVLATLARHQSET